MLIFTALLLGSPLRLVQALQFAVPDTLPQCSQLSVNWSDAAAQATNLNLTVLPFDSVPFNLTIPNSAWTSTDAGSYSTILSFESGTSFILNAGSGSSAATSNIVTVIPSTDASCLSSTPSSRFHFTNQPANCNPSLLNISYFSADLTDVPVIQGYVPSGNAPFPVAAVGSPPSYFVTVQEETQILLEFIGPGSNFGTSKLVTVGGPLSSDECFSKLSFNAEQNGTSTASKSESPTARNKSAKLIGIITGSVLGSFILLWLLFFFRERHKRQALLTDRRIVGGRRKTSREWSLGIGQSRSYPRVSRIASTQNFPDDRVLLDRVSSSSKLFPSFTPQAEEHEPSSKAPPNPRQSNMSISTARLARPTGSTTPRVRTPSEYVSFESVSLHPSLLPEIQRSSYVSLASTRQQTRESGRIV